MSETPEAEGREAFETLFGHWQGCDARTPKQALARDKDSYERMKDAYLHGTRSLESLRTQLRQAETALREIAGNGPSDPPWMSELAADYFATPEEAKT